MKHIFRVLIFGFIAGFAGAYTFYIAIVKPEVESLQTDPVFSAATYDAPAYTSIPSNTPSSLPDVEGVDFSEAARRASPSVVFIYSISSVVSYSYWDCHFGVDGSNSISQVSVVTGLI